ncbi:MAG: uroporphyrinogen decarboxylase [Anaerolineae bacterium]|nr:MAG: uroporphyrinogen decarboxylase [Anaerolineae bacterium]
MSKRERLTAAIAGESVDRTPVALWRHFPVDDQDPFNLAAATLSFQWSWDWDFVKVTPASSFCVRDWGVEDRWVGNDEGTREYVQRAIEGPEDWRRLRVLDARQGSLGGQLRCLEKIVGELGKDTPVIQTVFSPLAQAKNLAGNERLLVHMRRYPEALKAGLETVTKTTSRFIRLALKTGIDGVFFAVQHARYEYMSEEEYAEFGRAYDMRLFEELEGSDAWFNVLHLHGEEVMFDLLADYPVQAWNWHDQETPPSLGEGRRKVTGAVVGGLRQWETLLRGDPKQVRAEAQAAMEQTDGRSFILGTGCVTPITAPWANLRAVREVVEGTGG